MGWFWVEYGWADRWIGSGPAFGPMEDAVALEGVTDGYRESV